MESRPDGKAPRARGADMTNGPCVYILRNLSTGKVYVGSSVNGQRRLRQHERDLREQQHVNKYLQFAWNKHGKEDFLFVIHEECTEENRVEREQWWIDHLQASNPTFGYNISHSVVSTAPAPLRSRISKQYWENLSDEEREAQSLARKAFWDDPEWRAAREAELATKGAKQRAKRAADPDFNARCLSGLEKQRADPEAQARRAAKIKAAWQDPERRAKQAERVNARMADPEYKAKHDARARSEESRAKLRAYNLSQLENPEIKAKRLAGLDKGREAFWGDPEKRANRLEILHAARDKAHAKRRAKDQSQQ